MITYDATRLVRDEGYLEETWQVFRRWYAHYEQDLWVQPSVLDEFGKTARLQVIFGTTALIEGFHAGEAHEWICKCMRDAFGGRGEHGGNYIKVLAGIAVGLCTGTYANAVVSREE